MKINTNKRPTGKSICLLLTQDQYSNLKDSASSMERSISKEARLRIAPSLSKFKRVINEKEVIIHSEEV